MSLVIEDGVGSGKKAKVNGDNRLAVEGVTRSEGEFSVLNGDAYNINTGQISLTSDGVSNVFYLKYNGLSSLIIKDVLVNISDSTGGSGFAIAKIIKNPTTGTLITSATDVDININRDFSSSKFLIIDAYKGAEGATLTDGDDFNSVLQSNFDVPIVFNSLTIKLGKGDAAAVSIQPPTGNTSQQIIVSVTVFEETLI